MFDPCPSCRNKNKALIQRTRASPDKQNINHKNRIPAQPIQKPNTSRVRLQDFQILKESAISALIEKQEIIQSLTFCNHEDLLVEIEQMTSKVKQLEAQNYELKAALQESVRALHEERHQWNEEHYKLVEEIDYLKDALLGVEASAQQTLQKNGELIVQNEQIWQQMNQLQTAYKVAQEKLHCEIEESAEKQQLLYKQRSSNGSKQHSGSEKFQIQNCYSYEKVIFDEICQKSILHQKETQKQEGQSQSIRNVLTYETEDWLEQPSIQSSIREIREKHCLGRSIKAINLIDNYSINSKNNPISDIESQFTSKYFRYTNQNHLATIEKALQDSCQHIPEEPQQEMFASQHQLQKGIDIHDSPSSNWLEKILYLATGVCVGALVVLKWKK